jgi:predicted XRE-type DNA-binding protein
MSKRRHETGSRNVFNELGVAKAGEHRIKAKLVFKIDTILTERGLKQVEAAV